MIDKIKTILGASAFALSLAAAPALAQDAEVNEGVASWDADGDSAISQEEFDTGFGEAGVYDDWDADDDGALSEEEFNIGLYESYDADDSGVIEEPEFGDVGDDIGDEGLFDV